jgi:spore germination protein YaaH
MNIKPFPFVFRSLQLLPNFALSGILVLLLAAVTALSAQQEGTHPAEWRRFQSIGWSAEHWQAWNTSLRLPDRPKNEENCVLQKRVFGWHPYWSNGLENQYDWSLLSDISYFAYEVNPNTGNANNTYSWATAPVVTQALANGVRVHLCVTLFSNHATFFGNANARQTLITNLINLIQQRGAHGVNIDFEAVSAAQSANLTSFIIDLSTQLKAAIPAAELSMALPAVDWSNVFNVAVMGPHVDLFIIMGYDYYWSGSTQAGPTDPLYSFSGGYNYNQSRSVTFYQNAGVPSQKLLLGLPYYGREWETTSNQVPANTTGNFHSSRTYKAVRDNSATYSNRNYHYQSASNYFVYPSGSLHRQCFINSEHTLARRHQFAMRRGLAGIGIWALGYDAGYSELWDLLRQNFTSCATQVCSDTIFDGGGPGGNYYNNEQYTYTIAPQGAARVILTFLTFQLENGFDTLWIYNGPSTASPIIGAYTGDNFPGTIQSSGPSLTIRFKSDAGVTAPGWVATYQCVPVSTNEPEEEVVQRLVVFPNPNSGTFIVQLETSNRENIQLGLFDLLGREVWSLRELRDPGLYEIPIEIPDNLPSTGLLLLRLRVGDLLRTARIVYQRRS